MYFRGAGRKPATTARHAGARPLDRRGKAATGRIVRLFVGQGHGFIRLADDREVFFHRADIREGTTIMDLGVGDAVTFELLEDTVSGARAVQVARRRRRRR